MSFINRPKPTPPPQSPPVGITILRPTTPGRDRYSVGHFFQGACICACPLCTLPGGKTVICICLDCHVPACGARSLGGAA